MELRKKLVVSWNLCVRSHGSYAQGTAFNAKSKFRSDLDVDVELKSHKMGDDSILHVIRSGLQLLCNIFETRKPRESIPQAITQANNVEKSLRIRTQGPNFPVACNVSKRMVNPNPEHCFLKPQQQFLHVVMHVCDVPSETE